MSLHNFLISISCIVCKVSVCVWGGGLVHVSLNFISIYLLSLYFLLLSLEKKIETVLWKFIFQYLISRSQFLTPAFSNNYVITSLSSAQ